LFLLTEYFRSTVFFPLLQRSPSLSKSVEEGQAARKDRGAVP
jgi:hypothetical protein